MLRPLFRLLYRCRLVTAALFACGIAAPACAQLPLDADLINVPRIAGTRAGAGPLLALRPGGADSEFEPATPQAPQTTLAEHELSIADASELDFETHGDFAIFGVTGGAPPPGTAGPQAPGNTGPRAPGNTGPQAPGSSGGNPSAERIRQRNEEAKVFATLPGYFKFIVDKDSSRMAVFDGVSRVGVFTVAYGSNAGQDDPGSSGASPRNTPIGVFRTHAGRPSANAFTWFIPFDVPGRTDMGLHGPKDVFLGSLLGLIHWTRGCIATTSKADLLVIKAAHAKAIQRGTPSRLIIGRGIDFRTIPGW